MGVGIVPKLESRIAGVDPYCVEGKALAAAWPAIDDLACQLGVIPLSELGDNDSSLADNAWFSASDGLKTVNGLLQSLKTNSDTVPDAEYVLYDLEDIRDVLDTAQKNDIRFRFEMLG